MKVFTRICCCLLFTFSSIISCYACDCTGWYNDNFCEQINDNSTLVQLVVIEVESDEFMKVVVLDRINIESEADTLIINGNDGGNCGQNLNVFTVADTLIASLYDMGDPMNTFLLQGECSRYYVKIENGFINEGGFSNMSYSDFLTDLEGCIEFTDSEDFEVEEVILYPNPVNSYLIIENPRNTISSLEIYDIYGRSVYKKAGSLNAVIDIELNHLNRGSYVVVLNTQNNGLILKRITKQ